MQVDLISSPAGALDLPDPNTHTSATTLAGNDGPLAGNVEWARQWDFVLDQVLLSNIDPGKPWRNGCNESSDASFRRKCLNAEVFQSQIEAHHVIEQWRRRYNAHRSHSSRRNGVLWIQFDPESLTEQVANVRGQPDVVIDKSDHGNQYEIHSWLSNHQLWHSFCSSCGVDIAECASTRECYEISGMGLGFVGDCYLPASEKVYS